MKILAKTKWLLLFASINLLTIGHANAFVIDLDSKKNGYDKPIDIELAAGTYEIVPVKAKYTAWTKWGLSNPDLVCANSSGCDRSQSAVRGWASNFAFEADYLTGVLINGLAADPDSGNLYKVHQGLVYPDPLSALANAWSAEFTLTKKSIVSFMLTDYSLHDNDGGMSLEVVPEPSILALMAMGLIGFGVTQRKKS